MRPHQNFSVVVGENGTGKSNLIDAVLFALGRSNRDLRVKRLSDLVTRGTTQVEARVTLRFCKHEWSELVQSDEPEEIKPIDGHQDGKFAVARWVRRSGEHGFDVDGVRRDFEDVEIFLKRQGLDPGIRHNVIAQQMVTEFANLMPKARNPGEMGFCEMFERAIGINHRDPRRKQLEEEVRNMEEEARETREKVEMARAAVAALEGRLKKDEAIAGIRTRYCLLGMITRMGEVAIE